MKNFIMPIFLVIMITFVWASDEYCPEDSIAQQLNQRSFPNATAKTISEILLRATRCESSTWYKIDTLFTQIDSLPVDSIRFYSQEKPNTQFSLLRLIGRYQLANMVAFLNERLQSDRDIYVRSQAAAALGQLGPRAAIAIPALIEGLRDKSKSGLCSNAINALGEMGEKGAPAVPFLSAMLKDERWYIRWRAARSLGKLGRLAYPALPVLEQLQQDEHPQVQKFAGEAIELINLAMEDL